MLKITFFCFISGLGDFPLSLPLAHNLGHPGIPTEFWPTNFGLHPSLIPPSNHGLLHPNVMHNYKLPNIHALLSQYMGLNNLFGYPQNLSMSSGRPNVTLLSNNSSSTTITPTNVTSSGTTEPSHSPSQSPKETSAARTSPTNSDKNGDGSEK